MVGGVHPDQAHLASRGMTRGVTRDQVSPHQLCHPGVLGVEAQAAQHALALLLIDHAILVVVKQLKQCYSLIPILIVTSY